jgi:hypothetical protein
LLRSVTTDVLARAPEMIKLMGEFNRRRGEKFNDIVAGVFEQSPRTIVRRRVRKIGSLRLQGPKGDLGDVDVLVADQKRRHLIAVECKDLALARTPYEMAGEMTNLFRGTEKKTSIVELHKHRVDWLCKHLPEVLGWLGITDSRRWKVKPLIVVDRELFTPFLQASPIPVVPLEEVRMTSTADGSTSLRRKALRGDSSSQQQCGQSDGAVESRTRS